MKRSILFIAFAALFAFAPAASAQAPADQGEPNAGSHIQFTGSFTTTGDNVAVAGISVPVANRWSILQVNAFAPKAGLSGVSFHSIEVEYARNLSDLFKGDSAQFNPSRFFVAVSGGAGTARDAQGAGNASFAFSAAGRLTLRLNDNTSIDLVNVRYWRSRIATIVGQAGGDTQLASGFRLTF